MLTLNVQKKETSLPLQFVEDAAHRRSHGN